MFFGNIIVFDSIALAILACFLSHGLLGVHPALAIVIGIAVLLGLLLLHCTRPGFWLIGGGLSVVWGFIFATMAYEFSGRKNFGPMKYDEAVLDYVISPEGYSLTVGGQTAEFSWQQAKLRHSRSDFLLYSDKKNCSVLPKRCLTPEQTQKLQTWAKA